MTTTTERIGMIIHPVDEPAGKKSRGKAKAADKVAPPTFATRAEQEAFYRKKFYERKGVPDPDAADTSNPTPAEVAVGKPDGKSIDIQLSPGMTWALLAVYRSAMAVIWLGKAVWFLFALMTATVIAGLVIGSLSA
jgi:hypothetical protein